MKIPQTTVTINIRLTREHSYNQTPSILTTTAHLPPYSRRYASKRVVADDYVWGSIEKKTFVILASLRCSVSGLVVELREVLMLRVGIEGNGVNTLDEKKDPCRYNGNSQAKSLGGEAHVGKKSVRCR